MRPTRPRPPSAEAQARSWPSATPTPPTTSPPPRRRPSRARSVRSRSSHGAQAHPARPRCERGEGGRGGRTARAEQAARRRRPRRPTHPRPPPSWPGSTPSREPPLAEQVVDAPRSRGPGARARRDLDKPPPMYSRRPAPGGATARTEAAAAAARPAVDRARRGAAAARQPFHAQRDSVLAGRRPAPPGGRSGRGVWTRAGGVGAATGAASRTRRERPPPRRRPRRPAPIQDVLAALAARRRRSACTDGCRRSRGRCVDRGRGGRHADERPRGASPTRPTRRRESAIESQAARRRYAVAHELGRHLRSAGFEQLARRRGARPPGRRPRCRCVELSGGQYSLAAIDGGSDLAVDRPRQRRRAPLGAHPVGRRDVPGVAGPRPRAVRPPGVAGRRRRGARLDAIFLDEGFGTLDADSLDTVAATIEALAGGGRMVGIVTHVRELAERVPVRYRARARGRTATVERVEA